MNIRGKTTTNEQFIRANLTYINLYLGTYTCLAESELDKAEASATLIVQDVPNPPALRWVECNAKDASVVWQPMGDNRAPILTYKIQYNTSFTPDTWETATGTFLPL